MKLLGVEQTLHGVEKTWLHTGDDGREKITTELIQDVAPIIKSTTEQFNSAPSRFGDGAKVASFPGVVLQEMAKQKGITFGEFLLGKSDLAKQGWNELLNGREFRAFRTRPGRVDMNRGRR